jgi:hypothetical protein
MGNSTITVFGKSLSFYVLFAFIGLWAGVLIALAICKKRNLPYGFIFRSVLGVLSIGFIAQAFVSMIPDFMLTFSYLLGLIAATVLYAIIGKFFHQNPRHCCEIGLIATNTFMIFSKMGCFFAGCCHGQPYSGLLSVVYSNRSHALLVGIPLFPIQIAEVTVRIIVLGFMLIIYNKEYFKSFRIPLYFSLMGISYFWGMLFWYAPMKTVNQNGIDYVLIFNILFGIATATCIVLNVFAITQRQCKFK